MSHPRFSFFDNPDDDILRHATRIKVELEVDRRGRLWLDFEVSGNVSHFTDDDDDESGGTCCREKPDSAEMARDLLSRFVAAKSEGGAT